MQGRRGGMEGEEDDEEGFHTHGKEHLERQVPPEAAASLGIGMGVWEYGCMSLCRASTGSG